MLGKLLMILGGYEASLFVRTRIERNTYFNLANEYCDEVGKPILRVGMRRSFLDPPAADVTLDLDPEVLEVEGGVWGDERDMPFADKEFGVVLNEHTLEHLDSLEDVQLAVSECVRVADKAIFLCPSPYSILSTFFHPTHYLRLWFDPLNNQIRVAKNKYRTGLGLSFQVEHTEQPPSIGQVLVSVDTAPKVISFNGGFLVT